MSDSGQIPITFPEDLLDFNSIEITDANRGVIAAVRKVERWPYHVFCLVGPPKSGLTTITKAWVDERKGAYFDNESFGKLSAQEIEQVAGGAIAIDGADQILTDALLLQIISAAERHGGALLLTANAAPARWYSSTKDLASRLKSAPIADLATVDEPLMRARIQRACDRAYLILPQAVEDYLVTRLGLSFAEIENAVWRLNGAASSRPLTVPLAREVLGTELDED